MCIYLCLGVYLDFNCNCNYVDEWEGDERESINLLRKAYYILYITYISEGKRIGRRKEESEAEQDEWKKWRYLPGRFIKLYIATIIINAINIYLYWEIKED